MDEHSILAQKEREHFDRLAEVLGETGTHRTTAAGNLRMERRAKSLARTLADFERPRVLEVGAGTGAFSGAVLRECNSLDWVGCDVSPKCVDIARSRFSSKYPNAHFVVADCLRLEFADESYDFVCGCSILHHLPIREMLREIHRVLRPGGGIWFSEPNMMNPQIAIQKNVKVVGKWLEDTEDETAFFRWGISRSLRDAGFDSIHVEPFDFLHPNVPRPFIGVAERMGHILERVPLLREIAGSLEIRASKPA